MRLAEGQVPNGAQRELLCYRLWISEYMVDTSCHCDMWTAAMALLRFGVFNETKAHLKVHGSGRTILRTKASTYKPITL